MRHPRNATRRSWRQAVSICAAIAVSLASAAAQPNAKNCRICHSDIYREWKQSWHSRSATNKNFLIALQNSVKDGISAQTCYACHAPRSVWTSPPTHDAISPLKRLEPSQLSDPEIRHEAWRYRADQTTLDVPERPDRARARAVAARQEMAACLDRRPVARDDNMEEGVNCQSCHEARGSVMVGPYALKAPHHTSQQPALKTVRACVSCHGQPTSVCQKQVQAYELSALRTKVVCQSCHMPASDKKLVQWINFEGLPTRKVASHAFPGVHDETTLRSAIKIEIEVVEGIVVIGLVNKGSGHLVPASPWRKLIALVQVYDGIGREIYRKRDGFFQERGNAIRPLGRENISFTRRPNHASVKVTLYYRFYPNQADASADVMAQRTFHL
jgi:hypothetical protein